ncbi:GEVED domain-containing protein [Taibaiella soli]|uniref:Ig-like domain-containing protein n=1 Tax=Taibaiella soli TaxID=1649169 RepID=A0A2W2BTP6_9BACT|nr:GEVED domain-containing protein [Taibaiella soli]PZF71173.1 hypothetical protein DN068_19550 [Taibaiella soli]
MSKAGYIPVAVTGFNVDAVCNGSGTALATTSGLPNGFDGGNYWLNDSTFAPGNGISPATTPGGAMPPSLNLPSAITPGLNWTLQSYSGNNALRIITNVSGQPATDSLIFPTGTNAVTAGELDFLYSNVQYTSGDSIYFTVNFNDGTVQAPIAKAVPNWFTTSGFTPAKAIGCRYNSGNNTWDNQGTSQGPMLYQMVIPIAAANYSKTIRSVSFTKRYTNVQNVFYVFGVTRNTVCTGSVLAGTVASTSGTTTCPNVNFTLSLPTASVGAGIIYQWQNSTNGGSTWSNIANATNVTYTGNQTVATSYRAYVVCGNGNSSDTTTSIAIGMSAANTCYCVPVAPSASYYISNFTITNAIKNLNKTSTGGTTNVGYSNYIGTDTIVAMQTIPFNFSSVFSTTSGAGFKIMVDWNQNGSFLDAGETIFATSSYPSTISGTASVPATALVGNTRLRIMADYLSSNVAGAPCTFSGSGEAEDYTFTVVALPPCAAPTAQATALNLTAGTTFISGSFTAASPAANKYIVLRTPGTAAPTVMPVAQTTYTAGGALGNANIISVGTALTFNDATVAASTQYTYSVFAFNDQCSGGPLYDTLAALNANATTAPVTTYTWKGNVTGSKDWQVAANWTPTRIAPDVTDILQFTDGLQDTVNNHPTTQTIRRLLVTNQTKVVYTNTAATTITLASDNVATTKELQIDSASSLTAMGASSITNFSGTGGTGWIAGTLEMASTSGNNAVNFTNSIDTVTASGTLAIGGTSTAASITGATAANLQVFGTFINKYTTQPGMIPLATWNTGSNCVIAGYTTYTGNPGATGLAQTFYNFTINLAGLTVTDSWSGQALNVTNNLNIISTGTGMVQMGATTTYTCNINNINQTGGKVSWNTSGNVTLNTNSMTISGGTFQLATTGAYTWNHTGNFTQTGGVIDLDGGTATSAQAVNIGGNINQTAGTFGATAATGSTTAPTTINFNGTAAQSASFNASPAGGLTYRISNPVGISLTGNGSFAGSFNVNAYGGIRISTTAPNPINTTLAIAYAASNTLLTYDQPGNIAATATVWPATAYPASVTLNCGTGNMVVVPFNTIIPTTLTMAGGDFNIGPGTMTIGTSATSNGTLSWSAGFIRLLPNGRVVRWYGTTGAPTIAGTGIGYYPIATGGGVNRNVSLYFATAALTAGGSIAVGYNNANGLTTGLSVADGTYTINKRTNSSWVVVPDANVNFGTNTIGMKINGSGMFTATPATTTNLRVMQASTVAGTHVASINPAAIRNGLALTDIGLANPYYIGAADTNMVGTYTAINSGNWSTGSTWDMGVAPGIGNDAYINPSVTVTADPTANVAKSLTIWGTGTLQINSNTVTIDSAVANNGNVNVNGGTLVVNGNSGVSGVTNNAGGNFNVLSGNAQVGPTGGGNKLFNNIGTLTVNGGNLNVNGNFVNGGTINQNGGDIRVDGNAGGNPTNSVAGGTSIVQFNTANMNFLGGTFTIVDPHVSSVANSYAFNYNAGGFSDTILHTFVIGDGASTDTSTNNAQGMFLKCSSGSKFAFGNIIFNGAAAANRFVTFAANAPGLVVNGNMTLNNGADVRINKTVGCHMYVNGNLTVNAGGKLTADSINFSDYAAAVRPSKRATVVTVNGTGIITNYLGTGQFKNVIVNNPNGVTFNMGTPVNFTGTFKFDASSVGYYGMTGPTRLYLNGSTLSELAGASTTGTSQTVGWVVGAYQKAATAGSLSHTYPIGDSLFYSPLGISGGTGAITTAGAISAIAKVPDHPAINLGTINPSRDVNRYFSVTPVGGLTFGANLITATLNWNAADVDAGATPANFKVGKFDGTTWTYPTVSSPLATSISGTGMSITGPTDFIAGEACAPINITTPPVAQLVCLGSPATFTVGLTSTSGATFQWQKAGVNIAGATNATYTIANTVATDAANYSVIVGSSCPSVTGATTTPVALTFNNPATINLQPVAQSICNGSAVTFTSSATGTGITYQWQKNGININGATDTAYTIPAIVPNDSGNYTVVVMGVAPCGNVTSNIAKLTVKQLPLIITPSGTTTFCAGGSVVLSGDTLSTLTFKWLNGTTVIGGQTNMSYTATLSGNYSAVVTNTANSCSDTTNAITVMNGAPISTITPAGILSFCSGDSVLLTGPQVGGITYQWYLGGNPISNATNSTYKAYAPGSYTLTVFTSPTCPGFSAATVLNMNALPAITVTPATTTTFCQGGSVVLNGSPTTGLTYVWKNNGTAITPAATAAAYTANASGNYTVTVTSTATGCKNTSAVTAVTVNPLPTIAITAGGALTFCAGGSVALSANPATGLNYVWKQNGNAIVPAATANAYTANASGSYTVVATNPATGCANTSAASVVTVNPLPTVNVTASNGLTICQGGSTNLCATATGGSAYQWKLNTNNITGATTTCYNVTGSGSYTVTVTNPTTTCNITSTAFNVVANPAPPATITLLSPSASGCDGDTIWMAANTGNNLSYAWKRNATATGVTTNGFGAATSGLYTVTTTDGTTGCTNTSTPTTVTINPKPNSNISYTTPITFCEGGAVVLNGISATGVTYQWQLNGAPVSGATDNYFVADSNGSYAVHVTNSFGCSDVSNPPVLVVVNPLPNPTVTFANNTVSTGAFASYQWYFNSNIIPGATNQSCNVTQNGAYTVRVTTVDGCTNYSDVFFINNLGVAVVPGRDKIKVYPNPAHDRVVIDAPVDVNVVITDLTGQTVTQQAHAKDIQLGDIASGLYMIIVTDASSGQILLKDKLQKN